MICKKCANIFDDSLLACPMCGWSVSELRSKPDEKKSQPFKVNISEEKLAAESIPQKQQAHPVQQAEQSLPVQSNSFSSDAKHNVQPQNNNPSANAKQSVAPPLPNQPVKRTVPRGNTPPARQNPQLTRSSRPQNAQVARRTGINKAQRADFIKQPPRRGAPTVAKTNAPVMSPVRLKEQKRASLTIVVMMCVLVVIMMSLTAVSAKTDVFKQKVDAIKTVALSGLSVEDSDNLQKYLNSLGLSQSLIYDSSKTTSNEFLSYIRPYDSKGLYNRFYESSTKITDVADPAERFLFEHEQPEQVEVLYSYGQQDADGYAYYKIAEDEIDGILKAFGLENAHTANSEDYYYYEGNYYFRYKSEPSEGETDTLISITSSKRIVDGSYYVECNTSNSKTDAQLKSLYLIAQKVEESENPWVISRISDQPVFDSNGKMNLDEGAVGFEMKTESFDGVAKDGTVYCRYTVKYPVFSGNSKGEQTANRLFSDLVNSIKSNAEQCGKNYKNYISYGGDKSLLPFTNETVCTVSYNKKGYISTVKETADNLPDLEGMKQQYEEKQQQSTYYSSEQEEQEEEKQVYLCKRSFEAYTFDKQTGDFVTKDSIISKDYKAAYELLYRIYNGYDYAEIADSLTTTEQETTDETTNEYYNSYTSSYEDTTEKEYPEVPEDEEELGKRIYESANAMCDEGYVFCFVTDEGYAKKVIIPYSIEEFFVFE